MAVAKTTPIPYPAMAAAADQAAALMKALAHPQRLLLLCLLSQGERTVGDLATATQMREAATSQQLARLRLEGLVENRRDGHQVHYKLTKGPVMDVISVLYRHYCPADD